ncbi:MAG: LptA/OstA family protein, partial [Porticoccaceae bacterium]
MPVAATAKDEPSTSNWDCAASNNGQWRCSKQQYQSATKRYRPAGRISIPVADPEEPRVSSGLNLDWVDITDMTGEQKRLVDSSCCGGYIEPEQNYPDAEMNPDDASLRINANFTEAITESAAMLEGDVQFSHGYRQARSDSAEIDQVKHLIKMQGNVQFREPGLLILGDTATLQTDTQEIEIDNPTYVIHKGSAHGTADSLSRTEDGIISLNRASFSTCKPGDSIWRLVSGKLAIDQNTGFATMKSVRMEVKEVPIFYFPYLTFPVTDRRASGLLFPSITVHGDSGVDFEQPIYWNIAANYDAIISPRYIQERGAALEIQGRHLSVWSMTEVSASYLGNDRGGKSTTKKDPFSGEIISSI